MNALTLFERELLSLFSSHIPLDSFSAPRGLSFLECTVEDIPVGGSRFWVVPYFG
jgi:hypothetical protein